VEKFFKEKVMMKTNKFSFSTFAMLLSMSAAAALTGCSNDSNGNNIVQPAYQTNPALGYTGTTTGLYNPAYPGGNAIPAPGNYQQGMYQPGGYLPSYVNSPNYVNPYLTANYSNLSYRSSSSFMFSLSLRSSPNFYYNATPTMLNTNTCMYRQYPTYTPTQCASYTPNCNCQDVVDGLRTERLELEARIRARADDNCPVGSPSTASCRTAPHHSPVSTTTDDTTTTDTTVVTNDKTKTDETVVTTETSFTGKKVLPSIRLEDAMALYNHLGRETEVPAKSDRESFKAKRVGTNYICFYTGGSKSKGQNYFCDLDIELAKDKAGIVDFQSPVGATASPDDSSQYLGTTVRIGDEGMAVNEGKIIITDTPDAHNPSDQAKRLFNALKSANPTGVKGGSEMSGGTAAPANIIQSDKVICYQLTSPSTDVKSAYQCEVKIDALTGEAKSI
jgi:hypothetical protein